MSAGLTGNDAISTYRSLAVLSSTTGGYLFDGSQPVAFYRSRLDSPDLTWEKTAAYNVAIDWSMFKGRLNITAEAYKSKTTDLLMSLAVAAQTGYTSRWTNIGSTSNKGIELSIESQNIVRPNFHWTTTLTMSHNDQMVDDIGSEDFISAYDSPGNNSYMMYGYVKGYPLNSLWGFKYGGTWKNADERKENEITKTYVSVSNTDGGARYYDVNHDGVMSREDLIYQATPTPICMAVCKTRSTFTASNWVSISPTRSAARSTTIRRSTWPVPSSRTSTATCSTPGIPCATPTPTSRAPEPRATPRYRATS